MESRRGRHRSVDNERFGKSRVKVVEELTNFQKKKRPTEHNGFDSVPVIEEGGGERVGDDRNKPMYTITGTSVTSFVAAISVGVRAPAR